MKTWKNLALLGLAVAVAWLAYEKYGKKKVV